MTARHLFPAAPIDPLNHARAVLTYWQLQNHAVLDMAWSRLSESDLPDDQALMAEVARERVKAMGLDVAAIPFNAARFPPVTDEPRYPGPAALVVFGAGCTLAAVIIVGLPFAMKGAALLGGKAMFLMMSWGWLS